jgi:hypothetical protein
MDPSAPIIIASAYDWQADFGVVGARIRVLRKPFDAAQIESLIRELHSPAPA